MTVVGVGKMGLWIGVEMAVVCVGWELSVGGSSLVVTGVTMRSLWVKVTRTVVGMDMWSLRTEVEMAIIGVGMRSLCAEVQMAVVDVRASLQGACMVSW